MSNKQESPIASCDEEVFLATTALEDFWDASRPLVFLGTWCRRYSRRSHWERLGGKTLDSPYCEEQASALFYSISELYDAVLGMLADRLNSVHGTTHTRRYWEICAGPWLLYYLHAVYDRYTCLLSALERYPRLTTLVLDPACFVVPADTMEFWGLLKDDAYNLQLYSRILRHMGREFPCRRWQIPRPAPSARIGRGRAWLERAIAWFQNPRQILHKNPYFPRLMQLRLALRTKCGFWPATNLPPLPGPAPLNQELRQKLEKPAWGKDGVERLLFPLIADDIPQSLLENYADTARRIEQRRLLAPKAIFSAVSWYFDDVFKQWAARAGQNGTLLLGEQHGAGYGSFACFLNERHELSIMDRYYSWGWTRQGCRAQVVPRPPSKLTGRILSAAKPGNTALLYVMSAWSRYLRQFPITTRYLDAYFDNQLIFLSALSPQAKSRLRLRPHREDLGRDVRQRIKDFDPSLHIEGWDRPLAASLADCSLYICDHPLYSTTFIEALSAGKPSLLFHSPRFAAEQIRPEAAEFYAALRSAGILWEDPRQAAVEVNSICARPWDWWNAPERRQAVGRFLTRFAKLAPDALEEWTREFNELAGAPQPAATEGRAL